MKKLLSSLTALAMCVSFLLNILIINPVSAYDKTADEIKTQITTAYNTAKSLNGGKSFNGWCGDYVTYQLQALNIISPGELGGNGNQWWSKMSAINVTSKGYYLDKYAGKNCLYDIINARGSKVYNIVVAFKYGYGQEGRTYGHVLLIHAILDQNVYYSESFGSGNIPEGGIRVRSVNDFYSAYSSYTFDGAAVFSSDNPPPPPTSGMTISGETVPPDQHTLGKNFPVKGIIKSNLPITEVWGGVYYWDWSKPVPKAYADVKPNSTTYDLSSYAFDYGIIFDSVPEGFYHYLICATDSSGTKYELINKDFKVGNPSCTSHSFGNWSVITAATCTTDGSQKRSCSICGYSETGTIAKTGHSYTETKTDPTCTEDGKIVTKCSKCGDSKTTTIAKTGHKYGEWTTSSNATCIADGAQIRTCSVCGHTETKDVSKSGHKYIETVIKPSCIEKGYTLYECSVCGDSYKDKYTDIIEHSYKIETIDETRQFKCSTCDSSFLIPFEGSGTESDPFRISSEEDLRSLSDIINDSKSSNLFFNKHYIQTADINLNNKQFTPIANKATELTFSGIYNGNYKKISGLNIEESHKFVGLFGWVKGGEIKNLSVYGNVTVHNEDNDLLAATGGIVGELCDGGKIINCSFTGKVSSYAHSGGIAGGLARGGVINNSYFNGTVNGNGNAISGIVGIIGDQNNECAIEISNCYAVGSITSSGKVIINNGIYGVLSLNNANSKANIKNNYYISSMLPDGTMNDKDKNCIGMSSTIMKMSYELLGEPFINDSDNLNNGYPIFEWQLTPYQFKGNGTAEDPYQISSKKELEAMRDLVNSKYYSNKYSNSYYIQTADIDLKNELWEPIGIGPKMQNGMVDLSSPLFRGNYDGNYHTIKNLYVNRNDGNKPAGLFGSFQSSLAIENLIVYGTVKSDGQCVGGISGEIVNTGGTIKNCAFIGNVSGKSIVGGITGTIYQSGSVIDCYHIGEVSSIDSDAGYIGGIIGVIQTGDKRKGDAIISNSYHIGKIFGSTTKLGGIVGDVQYSKKIESTINVSNCYYNKDDCENSSNYVLYTIIYPIEIDITPVTSALLKKIAEDLGEPFVTNTDTTLLEGYPVFSWQLNTSSDITGDLNNDNSVDLTDLTTLSQYLLQDITFDDNQLKLADVNHDGKVDICDLAVFKQYVMNEISSF